MSLRLCKVAPCAARAGHLAACSGFLFLFFLTTPFALASVSSANSPAKSQQASAKDDAEIRTIEYGNLVERQIQTGQTHAYLAKCRAGGVLRVRLEADPKDFSFRVRNGKDEPAVILDREDNKGQGITFSAFTEDAGDYKILVTYNKKDIPAANYKLQIEDIRAATPRELSQNRAEGLFLEAEKVRRSLSNKTDAQTRQDAIEKYTEAGRIFAGLEDNFGVAKSLNSVAFIYRDERARQKDPEAAKQAFAKETESFKQAISAIRKTDDRGSELIMLNNLGTSYALVRDLKEAVDAYSGALALARKIKNSDEEERTLQRIKTAYASTGEVDKGLEFFNQQLADYRAAGNRRGEGLALLQMGDILRINNQNQQAVEYYRQSLAPLSETQALDLEAAALNNMGLIYRVWGEYQKALDAYGKVVDIDEKIGTPRGQQTQTLNNLGLVYFYLGDAKTALDYHNKALEYSTAEKDQRNRAFSLNNAGLVYDHLGNRQKALDDLQEAQKIREGMNDKAGQCSTLSNIGEIYRKQGDSQKSIEIQQRAIDLCRRADRRRVEALATTGLGKAYFQLKDYDKALECFNRALELSRAFNDRNAQVEELYFLALIEYAKGNFNQALTRVREAVSIIESLRASVSSAELRAALLSTMQETYEFYIDLLMRLHQDKPGEKFDAQALNVKESARARSLLEILSESRSDLRQGVRADLLAKERALQQQFNEKAARLTDALLTARPEKEVASLKAELEKISADYERVQAQIRTESPRYAALTQPQPLSLAEIQQQVLDKDSLLLEYSLGEKQSYLWAVSSDSISSYVLPKRSEIEAQAKRVYKLLTARNDFRKAESDEQRKARITQADAEYPREAAKLSQMVLAPAASLFAKKRLVVVADGALQYIPFAALPSPLKTKKFEPVVVRNEIVNLPSASTIAVLRRETQGRKEPEKMLAVIADPVFSDNDERVKNIAVKPAKEATTRGLTREDTRLLLRLDDDDSTPADDRITRRIRRLPFTRQEANDIAGLVPKDEMLELLDFDANRTSATAPEMNKYRYIHFASHGYINAEQPQLSAIVLSLVDKDGKPQPQGGFLRTIDIYNLNLPADMVVLSACETGLGKEVRGEGLVGLTRGFMYAGAPRVVVSLWSVSDRATAKLMERFYKRMLKRDMTPAAALRAAQRRMLDEKHWAAPYYWAAFILQGEWR